MSLADDFKGSGRLLALVFQIALEYPPARIQHALGHACFDQLETAHVTDDDSLVPIDHLPGELMQGIGSTARGLAMNALGLTLMATALRRGELIGKPERPAAGCKALPLARDGNILQPQP